MNTWDVFTGSATVPPGALTELAALRAALPGYNVTITSHSPTHRFEATHRHDGPGTCCVISSDPADLWRELADRARDQTCNPCATGLAPEDITGDA
jgi:hypothetical protein